MIIVAGTLRVAPERRAAYLDGSAPAVVAAREARGCLDFAVSADVVDPGRINVYERWETSEDLRRFRGAGPDAGQLDELLAIEVAEYEVVTAPAA